MVKTTNASHNKEKKFIAPQKSKSKKKIWKMIRQNVMTHNYWKEVKITNSREEQQKIPCTYHIRKRSIKSSQALRRTFKGKL
ncbi:hypothetical protein HYE32_03120 [Mycoplasmopsis bovis]|nr:hypothetical protein [Mycoplasmopsis bovis]QQH22324.1 hypothetical protein HYE32_03120 [Mycoplasmopsis bovis]